VNSSRNEPRHFSKNERKYISNIERRHLKPFASIDYFLLNFIYSKALEKKKPWLQKEFSNQNSTLVVLEALSLFKITYITKIKKEAEKIN
jgi:hypothetical protein